MNSFMLLLLCIICNIHQYYGDESTHIYEDSNEVILWLSKFFLK